MRACDRRRAFRSTPDDRIADLTVACRTIPSDDFMQYVRGDGHSPALLRLQAISLPTLSL
jgi:hypothetical protein